jgi:hypothetical protein
MRRHDIVSGILLILFIIDFALAAPNLYWYKRNVKQSLMWRTYPMTCLVNGGTMN